MCRLKSENSRSRSEFCFNKNIKNYAISGHIFRIANDDDLNSKLEYQHRYQ